MSNIRESAVHYSTLVVADSRRLPEQTRASKRYVTCSSTPIVCRFSSLYRCRPALLIGINAFSKLVHIITNLPEEAASSHRVSNTLNDPSPLLHELALTDPQHYCMDVCTNGEDAQCQVQLETVNATGSTPSVVHEAVHVHACTQSSIIVSDGGENDCINIITLHSVWRLTVFDTDDTDSTDDQFMIPIEESLISQQSSSHELVC